MTKEAIIITSYWNLYEAAEANFEFDAWKWNLDNIEFVQIVSGELKWHGLGVAY